MLLSVWEQMNGVPTMCPTMAAVIFEITQTTGQNRWSHRRTGDPIQVMPFFVDRCFHPDFREFYQLFSMVWSACRLSQFQAFTRVEVVFLRFRGHYFTAQAAIYK